MAFLELKANYKPARTRQFLVDEDEEFNEKEKLETQKSKGDSFDFKELKETKIKNLNDSRQDDFEGFEDYF